MSDGNKPIVGGDVTCELPEFQGVRNPSSFAGATGSELMQRMGEAVRIIRKWQATSNDPQRLEDVVTGICTAMETVRSYFEEQERHNRHLFIQGVTEGD